MMIPARLLLLDGGFGTQVQEFGYSGCPDELCLSHPEVVAQIHQRYLEAGADLIETNSFGASSINLEGFGLADKSYEIAYAAAKIASQQAKAFTNQNQDKPRYVVGSMGPTSKSATLAPLMDDPITPEDFQKAYYLQAKGLIEGGADMLMIETVIDSLNAKMAIAAIRILEAEKAIEIPIMLSMSMSDSFGRLLSGESIEEFYAQISNEKLFSIGLNCSLGAEQMLPFLRNLSKIATTRVSAHPNAGMPDMYGKYSQSPEDFAVKVKQFVDENLASIVGGCCGTTPEHIKELAAALKLS